MHIFYSLGPQYAQSICTYNNPGHVKLSRCILNCSLRITSVVTCRVDQLHKLKGPVQNEYVGPHVQRLLKVSRRWQQSIKWAEGSSKLGTCVTSQVTYPQRRPHCRLLFWWVCAHWRITMNSREEAEVDPVVLLCSSPKQIQHHLWTNVEQLFENPLPEGAPVINLLTEPMYLSSILIRRALQYLPPFLQPLILLAYQARYSCCVSPKHFILSQS